MAEADDQNEHLVVPDNDDVDEASEVVVPLQSPGDSEAPRTIGGFVVDDEDEEEEYTPELSNDQPFSAVDVQTTEEVESNLTNGQQLEEVPTSNELPIVPDQLSSTLKSEQDDVIADATTDVATDDGGQTDSAPYDPAVPSTNGASTEHPEHPEHTAVVEPSQSPSSSVQAVALSGDDSASNVTKARLPHDHIGLLEDRIKDDPRGDVDAWIALVNEYRRRNKLEEARKVYSRFFEIFPTAAEQWVAYAEMELEMNDWAKVEAIFSQSLLACLNIQLWSTYLNYIRRRNVVSSDKTGQARKVVTESYEFVLQTIGQDKDAGQIWQDYVQFIRSSPEQVGGTTWQDQQKMDLLRKVYQKAVSIPTQAVQSLWKEYDAFELGINKQTGRKFLQDKSPSYMTARSASTTLQNLTRDLNRSTTPRLPPVDGFEGDTEFRAQVQLWRRWVEWEKEDPLVLKEEDEAAYKGRIVYVYKQAVMTLRFWPEMWYEAANFCFSHGLEDEGNEFLSQGMTANPENCLLAFRRADRIETTATKAQTDDSIRDRGNAVRAPYDSVLDALYELGNKVKERQQTAENRARENAPKEEEPQDVMINDEDNEDGNTQPKQVSAVDAQIEAIRRGSEVQLKMLQNTITYAWIALLRAMRRVQGKGGLNTTVGGSRQVFADGRKRGRLTSEFYIANALIEYHCYQDPVATKIFDRGLKLFGQDERIALEYIRHLMNINDTTNARAVFETSVTRFTQDPALTPRAKSLFEYMHDFESRYGELSSVTKLETRMRELFPEDPQLKLFASRYSDSDVDPAAMRPVISPTTQMRPKLILPPVVQEQHHSTSIQNSPHQSLASLAGTVPLATLSPKRPLDDSDTESTYHRNKIPRAESPLKGAAGRRLAANRSQLRQELQPNGSINGTPQPQHLSLPNMQGPPPLPPEVYRLLSMIPRAESYNATRFDPQRMADLLRSIDLSRAQLVRRDPAHMPIPQLPNQYGYPQNSPYGYPR